MKKTLRVVVVAIAALTVFFTAAGLIGAATAPRAALTGQQFQSADNEPYYVLFEDFTHVKFYRRSLHDACVLEGATFDGFVHVDDWVPQRLVTATGPNPLPR